jgi:hypothetical protein
MDDITAHGNIVKFNVDETFLRADTMARLSAIEKMLQLELSDIETAREMESMTPYGNGEVNDINI